MKKIIACSLLAFISIMLFAQANSVLTVLGQASLKVVPDVTTVTIVLSSIHQEYDVAISNLEQKATDLKNFLKDQKISDNYIDSENFKVDKHYNFVNGERKYVGFSAKLWIDLKFQNDNDLVNTIINSINKSKAKSEISINYELSLEKQGSVKNRLIKLAIEDARENAKLIAESTGYSLAKIIKINYGVRENVVIDNSMNNLMVQKTMSAGATRESFTISPKEVVKSTQIIIYWMLTKKP